MRAVVQERYGGPEVLELREVETPVPGDREVRVRIRAAGVNAADWHLMRGVPYVIRLVGFGLGFGPRKPRTPVRGVALAGTVEAAGANATRFSPGDEVYGEADGAFAEYAAVPEDRLARKPAALTFEQAAALPVAATTAIQGLRDAGRIQAGRKVLIHGAAGGVGSYAVQLAKAFGADVTGVCSTKNVDFARSLGATEVIDYTREDFARTGARYDLIFYVGGSRSLKDLRSALTPTGTLVLSSGDGGRWLGPVGRLVRASAQSPFVRQQLRPLSAKNSTEDLAAVERFIAAGDVTPPIDRRYALDEVPDAIRYLEHGHPPGKVVVTV